MVRGVKRKIHTAKQSAATSDKSDVKKKTKTSDGKHGKTAACCSHHNFIDEEVIGMRQNLLNWYDANKRDLPWRQKAMLPDENNRAYAVWGSYLDIRIWRPWMSDLTSKKVWVSEVMLQQTQVATVINYYNKWLKKWPTLQSLSKASLEEVNEMWSGLGYYSRGRRLHEGAIKVVNELDGEMPRTAEMLSKHLPGVGKYTAAAIASIAFGLVTGLVDGNVIRVLTRLRVIGSDVNNQHVVDKLWSLANAAVDQKRPGDFNQALMELGATVCSPKSPKCESCPVSTYCLAHKRVKGEKITATNKLLVNEATKSEISDIESCVTGCNLCLPDNEPWNSSNGVENYPRKGKKKAARQGRAAVCVVSRINENHEIEWLLLQRSEKGLLAGLWEFPSADIDNEATSLECEDTVKNMIPELLGIATSNLKTFKKHGEVLHIFSHIHQTYVVSSGAVSPDDNIECSQPHRWLTRQELPDAALSTAMRKVFKCYDGGDRNKKSSKKAPLNKIDDNKQMSMKNFFKPK